MTQTSATGTQISSEAYVYDIAGRRIRVVRPQGIQQYFYLGPNPVLVLDGSGTVLSRNLYGGRVDELYAQEQAGQTKWTLSDRVHSVRDTISNTATVLNHFVYDSFGDLKAHSSSIAATENLFTSREFSTSPLVGYFRARYYSPDIGRFLSEDALVPFVYPYADNNPSTFADPLGLATEEYEEVTQKEDVGAMFSDTQVRPFQGGIDWRSNYYDILKSYGWSLKYDGTAYIELARIIIALQWQLLYFDSL